MNEFFNGHETRFDGVSNLMHELGSCSVARAAERAREEPSRIRQVLAKDDFEIHDVMMQRQAPS